MKRIIVLAALLAASAAFAQWVGGGYRDTGYGSRGASYQAGGVEQVDTVRVLSRDSVFPNTAAMAAGYFTTADTSDVVNQGNGGQAVKWGYTSSTASRVDSVWYRADKRDYLLITTGLAEDDHSLGTTSYHAYVWFSANGLEPGMKVESASVIFNLAYGGAATIADGGFMAARLDTISTDYRITGSNVSVYQGAGADTARFNFSFNHVNKTATEAWSPLISARLDRHDWGPRSGDLVGPGTYAAGTSFKLDVTDAVQQACDNAMTDPTVLTRGLLFTIYNSAGLGNYYIAAGSDPTWVGAVNGKGCPVFMATATTRRGAKPWSGVRVPIAFTFDDQYDVQIGYYNAMAAAGKTFDWAIYDAALSNASIDSLYALRADSIYVIHHSKTHPAMGTLTGDEIDPELARMWLMADLTGVTAADTLGVIDWAWPAGAGDPDKSIEVASRLIDYGYRSARGFGSGWDALSLAHEYETYLSWSGWVNRYNIRASNAALLFETVGGTGGAANTTDQITEELGDLIDLHYTNYGRAALILYGHKYDAAPADFISRAGLTHVINTAATLNSCEVMSYAEILNRRLGGAIVKTPAQVAAGRGVGADSNAVQNFAAHQDSAYAADEDAGYLQMWIGPK